MIIVNYILMIVIMLLIGLIKAEFLFFSLETTFHCLEILKFYWCVWAKGGVTEYNMNRENEFTKKTPKQSWGTCFIPG